MAARTVEEAGARRIDERTGVRSELSIPVRALLVGLLGISLGLVAAGIAANVVYQATSDRTVAEILGRFLLDLEATIPAWYSALLLAAAAGLATVAAFGPHVQLRGRWLAFGVLLGLASLDETIAAHEGVDHLLRALTRDPTVGGYWVIPALGVVLLAAVVWVPLLMAQPPRLRRGWVLAGMLYLGGAVVVELLGRPFEPPETASFSHMLAVGLEEGLEMVGAAVFVTVLFAGFADASGRVRLTLGEGSGPRV